MPVLLLLPGPTDSWRSYEQVLDRLPSSIRAIAVSQRGHGDSDKPATGYRVADFAGDVVLLLDALDVDRAVLAGHSGSCFVGASGGNRSPLARRRPDSRSVTDYASRRPQATGFCHISRGRSGGPESARTSLGPLYATHPPAMFRPTWWSSWLRSFSRCRRACGERCSPTCSSTTIRPSWGDIDAPTLLLWGAADALVPRTMQDQLVTSIRGADLITYDGVGHTPRWDDPARFSARHCRIRRTTPGTVSER